MLGTTREGLVMEYENDKYCLEVIRDSDAENPRNWENIWTLSIDDYNNCRFGDIEDRKYYNYNALEKLAIELGIDLEKEVYDEDYEDYYLEDKEMEELAEEIQKLGLLKSLCVRGYYDYEVTVLKNLDVEDSEGYAFTSFKTIEKEYGKVDDENIKNALSYLEGEITNYNQYLQGDIYGFELHDKNRCECCNHIEYSINDSCWGFYGRDIKENGMLEHIDLTNEELEDLLHHLTFDEY